MGPNLDPNFDTLKVFLIFFKVTEKFKKISADDKKACKVTQHANYLITQ